MESYVIPFLKNYAVDIVGFLYITPFNISNADYQISFNFIK